MQAVMYMNGSLAFETAFSTTTPLHSLHTAADTYSCLQLCTTVNHRESQTMHGWAFVCAAVRRNEVLSDDRHELEQHRRQLSIGNASVTKQLSILQEPPGCDMLSCVQLCAATMCW